VAAARSVGIPARLAGCSESVVRGDGAWWGAGREPPRLERGASWVRLFPHTSAPPTRASTGCADHHWAEFYDPLSPGPFGDFWHTREGSSAGNPDGPWDSPSGPMLG
jgi:transglutaminase-like putative cysteine protease